VREVLPRPAYETFFASDLPALRNSNEYDIVELKADGIWGELVLEGNQVKVWSRTGVLKAVWEVPENKNGGKRIVLHGEYMFGSQFLRNPLHSLRFYAFDCTEMQGVDIRDEPFSYRRVALETACDGLPLQDRIEPVQQWRLARHDIQELWQRKVVRAGWEGLVLKKLSATYGYGFARIKKEYEADYVCMGFMQSDAEKYKGQMVRSIVGGLYFDGKLKQVIRCSGMAEDERAEMYQSPELYIGKVFTVRGKGRFKSGALRHPNFIRLHPEKSPLECTYQSTMSQLPLA